jgi:hypothetical protein
MARPRKLACGMARNRYSSRAGWERRLGLGSTPTTGDQNNTAEPT